MTARSYDRLLRVARTIADLAGEERIGMLHLAEALQYRTADSLLQTRVFKSCQNLGETYRYISEKIGNYSLTKGYGRHIMAYNEAVSSGLLCPCFITPWAYSEGGKIECQRSE